jgi:hypothetical protein
MMALLYAYEYMTMTVRTFQSLLDASRFHVNSI